MDKEMNNNNRRNHSKTLAIAGMGFLLIAAAFTLAMGNSGQQLVKAQQNQTQGGNATQVIVATPFDTFTANGVISATIGSEGGQSAGGGGGNQSAGGGGGNQSAGGASTGAAGASGGQESPYVLGGDWNLNVQSGNVSGFSANFIMVHPDGTGYHTHNITNFNVGNSTVSLVQGQETKISGKADIYTNGTTKWPGTNTTLTLSNNGAMLTIMPAAEDTDNHFQGQPIYGIVSGITGENGTTIAQTTPPGQQQQQEGGGGGGPLSGLFGGGNNQQGGGNQQGGNQSSNPILGPLQNLFGGGGGGQ